MLECERAFVAVVSVGEDYGFVGKQADELVDYPCVVDKPQNIANPLVVFALIYRVSDCLVHEGLELPGGVCVQSMCRRSMEERLFHDINTVVDGVGDCVFMPEDNAILPIISTDVTNESLATIFLWRTWKGEILV